MQNPLGKDIQYPQTLDRSVLYGIDRCLARKELGITLELPFGGSDLWRCYEFSWLNNKGKPESRVLELIIPCSSKNIVESKSLKLFLGSFSNEKFSDPDSVEKEIIKSLTPILDCENFEINLVPLDLFPGCEKVSGIAESLDNLDVTTDCYQVNSDLLKTNNNVVQKKVCTDLFRSLCPVTGQPDWATVLVEYSGKEITAESLLKYLISFRNHQGFHEEACERIFVDLLKLCAPNELSVFCFFTRRGGIDISPTRTTLKNASGISEIRTIRQ
jgi:7-cyano-7-deazaguanine reductase